MNIETKLIDMKLMDFADVLASKEPTPGGGSASALAGLLAASLGLMVAGLTVGKKAFLALSDGKRKEFAESEIALKGSRNHLSKLVDDDANSFKAYMTAIRMPKETDAERDIRDAAIANAAKFMTQTPLETCRACHGILRVCAPLAKYGNKNAISDVKVAVLLAYAGLEGAAANVVINLSSVDEAARERLTAEIERLAASGEDLRDELLELINRK